MPSITLTLPEHTMERALHAAAALQRPVEEILGELLDAALPPINDVPDDLQAELLRMTWLANAELWSMAQAQMTTDAQTRLLQLTRLQEQQALTPEEQTRLDALRQDYGRTTLLKARAYALLSLRGGASLLSQA